MKKRVTGLRILHNPVAQPPYTGWVDYEVKWSWLNRDHFTRHVTGFTVEEVKEKLDELAKHINADNWTTVAEIKID